MKSFIASLLFNLGLVAVVSAQGQIEGAFGQKLGTDFDPGAAASPSESDPSVVRYRFTPVAPFKGLTDYFVDLTPTTHRVCGIYASGVAEVDSARQLATLLDIILRQKYADDPPDPPDPQRVRAIGPPIRMIRTGGPNGDIKTKIVQRGQRRSVEVFFEGYPWRNPNNSNGQEARIPVHLYYRDEAMTAEAFKEAEAIKKEKDAKLAAEAAVREKAAQEAREKQEAEEARKRAEELVRLKEKATTLDTSGL